MIDVAQAQVDAVDQNLGDQLTIGQPPLTSLARGVVDDADDFFEFGAV